MTLQQKMEPQYSFTSDEDGNEVIAIKSGDDFPYRIRKKNAVAWRLDQSFSARASIKPSYKKVGDFLSREEALQRIVMRHNKSCKHMTNWTPIT